MPETALSLKPVVLASASATRIAMLRAAGLEVEAVASGIDEAAVVAALAADREHLPPADIAAVLAEAKAHDVAAGRPGDFVIGADQTLDLEGELFVKARTLEEARRNLLRLRGRTHALHSAVTLVHEGRTVWSLVDTAWLTMRDYTPEFVGRYQAAAGEGILGSVGGYRLEGLGIQLFEAVEGDWYTVLGLPLLPLVKELRRHAVLDT